MSPRKAGVFDPWRQPANEPKKADAVGSIDERVGTFADPDKTAHKVSRVGTNACVTVTVPAGAPKTYVQDVIVQALQSVPDDVRRGFKVYPSDIYVATKQASLRSGAVVFFFPTQDPWGHVAGALAYGAKEDPLVAARLKALHVRAFFIR